MRNLVKIACLSGILLVSFCSANASAAAEAETRPHTPEASTLPVQTAPPATTNSTPKLDTTGLVGIMEKNRSLKKKPLSKNKKKRKKRRKK